jgi:poly-gamma-glutamate synthesis protein (capsule biosynthesis protein)
VLVFAFGLSDSGIPPDWAAAAKRPGVARLADLSSAAVRRVADLVARTKGPRDLALASIHWGGNWGYRIPEEHHRFARTLIDEAGVDLVQGHSSHHPKGLEVWRGQLILYGCGDFLNDYEGIGGYEAYRGDLIPMYLPTLDPGSGRLLSLNIHPMQLRRLRLNRATPADARWLGQVLTRESAVLGTQIQLGAGGQLHWAG